ncbi:MAG: hypothetical protein C4326_04740 [Ignavibacteria bacterium]
MTNPQKPQKFLRRQPAVLIMTATITPPSDAPHLLRSDPLLRLQDYRAALQFYVSLLDRLFDRIVFVDNSCSDLTSLADAIAGVRGRVELVTFAGLDHPSHYGRAFGEFKLLDYAMANIPSLRDAEPHTTFWKITGRYRVTNLTTIIEHAPRPFALYFDLKRYPIPWFDTRLMAWTSAGYRLILQGIYEHLREDLFHSPSEEWLYKAVQPFLRIEGVVPRFTRVPRIEGIRGHDNQSYSGGWNFLKYLLRSAARRVFPPLWI